MNLATVHGENEKSVLYRSVQRNKKAETTMTIENIFLLLIDTPEVAVGTAQMIQIISRVHITKYIYT
jgi:hypothetical protein